MKRLLAGVLIFGSCGRMINVPSTPTEPSFKKVVFAGGVKDIVCLHKSDFYDDLGGRYMLNIMLRNTGKINFTSLKLVARFYNASGREIAYSADNSFHSLASGDSSITQIQCPFQKVSDLPEKIIVTVISK